MHEEINQIEQNQTWDLVPKPTNKNIIGTKWVFRNKLNERGEVVRNKARLVWKGNAQIKGLDFDENFTPIARLETIRMFLVFYCFKKFKLYRMDVKFCFLNGKLQEYAYIEKPYGF